MRGGGHALRPAPARPPRVHRCGGTAAAAIATAHTRLAHAAAKQQQRPCALPCRRVCSADAATCGAAVEHGQPPGGQEATRSSAQAQPAAVLTPPAARSAAWAHPPHPTGHQGQSTHAPDDLGGAWPLAPPGLGAWGRGPAPAHHSRRHTPPQGHTAMLHGAQTINALHRALHMHVHSLDAVALAAAAHRCGPCEPVRGLQHTGARAAGCRGPAVRSQPLQQHGAHGV